MIATDSMRLVKAAGIFLAYCGATVQVKLRLSDVGVALKEIYGPAAGLGFSVEVLLGDISHAKAKTPPNRTLST